MNIILPLRLTHTLQFLGALLVAGVTATQAALPTLQPLLSGRWQWAPGGTAHDVTAVGNYAYLALGASGLAVVDVSDPANSVRVGSYTSGSGFAFGVAVSGNYAYVAAGDAGLQIIDVSNPTNCVSVGGIDPPGFAGLPGLALSVAVSGNFAYIADAGDSIGYLGHELQGGLHMIDISNPTNCLLVGSCATFGAAIDVAVSGHHAYVTGFAGLEVIDVSDPANCLRVGGLPDGGLSGVAVRGNYAYTTSGSQFLVVDVSDPTNCVVAGRYYFDPLGDVADVALWGKYAYVVYDRSGLLIFDVSNPPQFLLVGRYDNLPGEDASAVAVADGRVYLANYYTGLRVLPTILDFQLSVRVNATPNLPFSLEAATHLNDPNSWQPLLTTNVATMPFDFVDFDVKLTNKPAKFYRVRQ